MKTQTLAALALALPLSIGSAWATTSPTTYDYGWHGNGIEVYDYKPYVSEHSSFDLSKLNLSSNSVITLTFKYSDVDGSYDKHGNFNSESWTVYADNFIFGVFSADKIPAVHAALDPATNTASLVFSSSSNASTFQSILSNQKYFESIDFWFGESTLKPDSFKLYSASLSVTTAAPVPEPESYALFAAGLALVGAVARRRAGKKNA